MYAAHVVAVVLDLSRKWTVDDGATPLASIPFFFEFARGVACCGRWCV